MKIIILQSSNRKNGNTERVMELFGENLQAIAHSLKDTLEIETISLGRNNLEMCLGCRQCFHKGEEFCPLKDDLLAIRDKLHAADGYIVASPVYVEDVNGVMKNWIDRMAFNNHRPAFAGKSAVIVTTSGMGSTSHAQKTMQYALMAWGIHVSGRYKFRAGALTPKEELKKQHEQKLKQAANRFYMDLKRKKASNPSFYSLLVFKVQQICWQRATAPEEKVSHSYWKGKGLLEPKCTYFTSIRSSWLKVAIARMLGKIVYLFFQ